MAYNGSGTYVREYTWVTDKNNSVKITASRFDDEHDGFATALSLALLKDGQQTNGANQNWGGYRITNLGNATADADALNRVTADGRYVRTGSDGAAALAAILDEAVHATTDVASATTCDIGAAATDRVRITGTTTITSLGTGANRLRFVHFADALTLTHNGTSLILPGSSNIVTAAGDAAIFSSDGSGNWRCLAYQRAGNLAPLLATDTEAAAGSDAVKYITPAQLHESRVDVASATTTDIGAAASNFVRITGTTTITGLGTAAAGVWRDVMFAAALTLTHNGTSLLLPGAANITTAADDRMRCRSLGSGNWIVMDYTKADGTAVTGGAMYATRAEVAGVHTTGTVTSGTTSMTVASATGITAGMFVTGEGITPGTTVSSIVSTTVTLSQNANTTLSSKPVSFYRADRALSPGNAAGQLARAWVNFNGTGTVSIRAAYNVSSITDNATGDYTVNFTTAMPDVNYAVTGMSNDNGNLTTVCYRTGGTFTASAVQISVVQDGAVLSDSANVMVAVFR